MIVLFVVPYYENFQMHMRVEDIMINSHMLIVQIWQSLIFTLFISAMFLLCGTIFKQCPGFLTFYSQILHQESQLLKDIFLDDPNPIITTDKINAHQVTSPNTQAMH